jgi:hypothetical protein
MSGLNYDDQGKRMLDDDHAPTEDRAGLLPHEDGLCSVCNFPLGEAGLEYPAHLPVDVTKVRDWLDAQGGPYPATEFTRN